MRAGSAANSMTLGSFWRCVRRLHGDLLDDRARHAVDEPRAARGRVDAGDDRSSSQRGRSRRRARRDVVDGAARRRPSRPSRRGPRRPSADRVAHRVAGRQRGRDDRRAEHQPDDDQRRPPAPAADVPHAELAPGRGCAGRGRRARRARAPSATSRTTRSVPAGMPKSSFIGYATSDRGRSANATSYDSRPGGERKSVT